MKAFSKAITWLLVVVVLLGVFGLLYSFVGNGQRNFYVRYGNTPIPARADNYEFEKNAYTVIECGTLTGQKVEYSVTVTFDTKDNFETAFNLNDNPTNYKYELYGYDCTELFNVAIYDDCFMFYIPQDLTVAKILQHRYPDDTITGVTEVDLWVKDYFVLTVTDKVECKSTVISFH